MNEVIDMSPASPPAGAAQTAIQVTTPESLLALAAQNGATIDQMERMMAIAERMAVQRRIDRQDQAVESYNEAFAAFRAEAVEIIKRKRVHFTSQKGTTDYKHAELSDVIEAVTPALSRHGLSASWALKQEKDWLWVTCTLKHKAGHSDSATMGGPYDTSGNKNPVQAIASTKTMLERQTLKAVCGVAEKGEDDDGRGGGKSPTDEWVAAVKKTTTADDLNDLVRQGVSAFAKDKKSYAIFRDAVTAHRATLGASHV